MMGMTENKRFTTNGYYVYDHQKEDKWLANEVGIGYVVTVMNNLDTKAKERSKALSKLQKENEQLNKSRDALISENRHIKKTSQTMLINERTAIGKSVLKQLWEQIQC